MWIRIRKKWIRIHNTELNWNVFSTNTAINISCYFLDRRHLYISCFFTDRRQLFPMDFQYIWAQMPENQFNLSSTHVVGWRTAHNLLYSTFIILLERYCCGIPVRSRIHSSWIKLKTYMLPVFVSHEIPIKDYFYTWRIFLPVGFLWSNVTHNPTTYVFGMEKREQQTWLQLRILIFRIILRIRTVIRTGVQT